MVMLLVPPKKDVPSPTAVALGIKLQRLRERVGKTQKEVAEALIPSLSPKTVSAYENGHSVLGSDDFENWAHALGVSVAELATALGFGLPPDTGCLTSSLATLFGPDLGSAAERALRETANLPPDEQAQVLDSVQSYVAGHLARRDHRT